MKSYLLYAPRLARAGDETAVDRLVVVRDAFSWMAFLTPFLWFLFHRCWMAALGVLCAVAGFVVLAHFLLLEMDSVLLVLLTVRGFVGLEATAIRGWSLRRKGFWLADAVIANNHLEAESLLVARWLDGDGRGQLTIHPVGLSENRQSAVGVIGLFPEPEGGR